MAKRPKNKEILVEDEEISEGNFLTSHTTDIYTKTMKESSHNV